MRTTICSTLAILLIVAPMAIDVQAASGPAVKDESAVSADGVPIHYAVEGKGPVTLVFVHGWSCDGNYWRQQVAAFAPSHRVVTLDLAGHGRSGRDRQEWTTEAFAQDVRCVIEKLDLERVVLVGHSMSGPVCVAAAALLPGRVDAVIGVDTMQDVDANFTPEQVKPLIDLMRADFKGFVTPFVRRMFSAGADSALVARVAGGMASAPPDIAVPVFEGLFRYDLRAGFAAARVPIREINSELQPTNVAANRAAAKDFDVVILKGVGHFPQLEKPAEFNAALATIVEQVAR